MLEAVSGAMGLIFLLGREPRNQPFIYYGVLLIAGREGLSLFQGTSRRCDSKKDAGVTVMTDFPRTRCE